LKLLELGVEPPDAKRLAGKVIAEHQEFRKVSEIVKAAFKLYISLSEAVEEIDEQPGDLRNALGYDALKDSDAISKNEW
jgi:hypothetical protein